MRTTLPLALLCSAMSTCAFSAGLLDPNSPAMLGDRNGLRPQLAEQGYADAQRSQRRYRYR
ncbi:hypothetical protein [Pseudomonas sp. AMR01]|uniref:hypothetical protein n=1 Tax=Pseudomonas sp. AMR01 TaxID=3064904 RepID=UPI0035C19D17